MKAKTAERPILFSTAMVRAILDGRKTMTRRAINPQPEPYEYPGVTGAKAVNVGRKCYWFNCQSSHPDHFANACPYGKVGDRLWVRETWLEMRVGERDHGRYAYLANSWRNGHEDPESKEYRIDYGYKWKPSIHMPREASRFTLEITSVRFEKLNQVTPVDCEKEAVDYGDFIRLWDSLNAKRGYSWESNPWVWVLEFKVVTDYTKAGVER